MRSSILRSRDAGDLATKALAQRLQEMAGLTPTRRSTRALSQVLLRNLNITSKLASQKLLSVGAAVETRSATLSADTVSVYYVLTGTAVFALRVAHIGGLPPCATEIDLTRVESVARGAWTQRVDVRLSDDSEVPVLAPLLSSPEDFHSRLLMRLLESAYGIPEADEMNRLRYRRLGNAVVLGALAVGTVLDQILEATNRSIGAVGVDINSDRATVNLSWSYPQHSRWNEFWTQFNTVVGTMPPLHDVVSSPRARSRWALEMNVSAGAQRFLQSGSTTGPIVPPDMRVARTSFGFIERGWYLEPRVTTSGASSEVDFVTRAVEDCLNEVTTTLMWRINGPRLEFGDGAEVVTVDDGLEDNPKHANEYAQQLLRIREEELQRDAALLEESGLKLCPDCAEEVRVAARKCRFCGFWFDSLEGE